MLEYFKENGGNFDDPLESHSDMGTIHNPYLYTGTWSHYVGDEDCELRLSLVKKRLESVQLRYRNISYMINFKSGMFAFHDPRKNELFDYSSYVRDPASRRAYLPLLQLDTIALHSTVVTGEFFEAILQKLGDVVDALAEVHAQSGPQNLGYLRALAYLDKTFVHVMYK